MKYGRELQESVFAPWRLSYMAYDVLKMELKSRQEDHPWTAQDESDFTQLLDNELSKVHDFVNAKLAEIDARITYCERTIQTIQKNPSMSSETNYTIMDEALTEILFDVNDLAKFTRVNFVGFQKILKKHDKWTGLDLKQTYVRQLREKPLDKQRFDVAIVYISALHDLCRTRGQTRTGNAAAGGDQNAFERATSKYWIHPDNITEVKAIIMLHLPVLIFNQEKKYEASDSAISSVYYDNYDFDLYTGRLQRDEGAEAIRFRWYGPVASPNIFIERKTHHAPWLDGASVKDRFRLKEPQVNQFVSRRLTADDIAREMRDKGADGAQIEDAHFIAKGVQQSFEEKHLAPILRVFYNRTAFQLPGDQRLRLSLDTDMTFIREDDMDGRVRRIGNNWRRQDVGIDHPFPNVPDKDILRFPYAILETKLQTHLGQEPPQWLTTLLDSHLVHEVPRFSKYLHGASHFFPDRIPLLPWWLSEMSVDIRKPRSENAGLSRSKSFKPLIDGKYRRAVLEEEERIKKSEAVAGGQTLSRPVGRRNSESTGNSYDPMLRPSSSTSAGFTAVDMHDSRPTLVNTGSPAVYDKRFSSMVDNAFNMKTSPNPNDKSYWRKSASVFARNESKDSNVGGNEMKKLGQAVEVDATKKKRAVKAEPKVFFANERTFISWLQFCALLLTVALNLLNFGDATSRITGGIFIGIAAAIAIYALYRFERRAWMINRQIDGRYDDLWGPAVLCVLVVVALIINFYLRFRPGAT
ncbi:hypothetical protein INT44_004979 [Umbelopsis vinacea]|uniref:Vacuolar transporter chaperone complex subunit 4 n=1 Tax=Umbelopsis vinacea TaxID=44442 RepID=A0A8H7Q8U3_9FUNG|nr:hypothetical protein INT44_004979 [Umbelopsis vinacea]